MKTYLKSSIIFSKNYYILIFLAFLASVNLSYSTQINASSIKKDTINWGIFAYLGISETHKQYKPIVDYLNNTLIDYYVKLSVLPIDEIYKGIENQQFEIVTTNPTHFTVVRNKFPLTGVIATLVPLDSENNPIKFLSGCIVVNANNSAINSLKDIKGKSIGYPSTEHMGGYRAQVFELYKAGVSIPNDISTTKETGTHQNTIRALLRNEFDVAFVRSGVIESMVSRGEIKLEQIKIINSLKIPNFNLITSTRLYPEWPVFALPHTNEKTVRKIASALFAIDPESTTAKSANIHGYTIPSDYLVVEELARTLKLPPYEKGQKITFGMMFEQYGFRITLAFLVFILLIFITIITKRKNTKIKQLLSDVKQSESKYRLLADHSSDVIWVLNLDLGEITYMSPAVKQLLGYNPDDSKQLSVYDILTGDSYDKILKIVEAFKLSNSLKTETKESIRLELKQKSSVDEIIWVEISARIRFNEVRQIEIVGSSRNINKRKMFEQKLIESEANLRTNVALKDKFFSIISHDLKGPIGSLRNIISMMNDNPEDFNEVERNEIMSQINKSIHNVFSLLENLLEWSMTQRGNISFSPQATYLTEIVTTSYNILKLQIDNKNISFNNLVKVNTVCYADIHMLMTVIRNLISNAIKFTAINGQIEIGNFDNEDSKGFITIYVKDSGVGMRKETLNSLFKIDSHITSDGTSGEKGTGLGLILCKEFVEKHGGNIWVESELNKGSTIYFTLPSLQ